MTKLIYHVLHQVGAQPFSSLIFTDEELGDPRVGLDIPP